MPLEKPHIQTSLDVAQGVAILACGCREHTDSVLAAV